MEISLKELYEGKATKIKNNNFFTTKAYVEPFVDRMSKYTDDFRVQVKLPDQVTYTKDGSLSTTDITYNRCYIQAVLPDDYAIDNHKKVVGMVYGIDVRKPVAKIFTGGLNMACTNLCVFSADSLYCQEIKPETAINYKPITQCMELLDEVVERLNKLKATPFINDSRLINENLGMWVRNCMNYSFDNGYGKVKLATSVPIDAYKQLYVDQESPYYVQPGNDTDMFNVYNAWTQIITDSLRKDVFNTCEKTILLTDILGL